MANKGKIVRFPVTRERKKRNIYGPFYVPCVVSGRYILFPKKSDGFFGEGEYIGISIMTETENSQSRKLCEMIVTREDLLRAVNSVKSPVKGK